MSIIANLGLDRYERKARLGPVLLTVLPPLLLIPVWLPEARSMTGGAALAALAGAMLTLLMSWVRQRGRRLQIKIFQDMGGAPSTQLLRHGNTRLAAPTRERVHRHLRRNGIVVPTAVQQQQDADSSDVLFASCADWLKTRAADDRLLLEENMEFGFRRNTLAVKQPALTLLVGCGTLDLAGLFLRETSTEEQLASGVVAAIAYFVLALAWLKVANVRWVEDAGWAYAQRLLATADKP